MSCVLRETAPAKDVACRLESVSTAMARRPRLIAHAYTL